MNYQFNLQPWREEKRAEQKKIFITTSVAIGGILLALLGLNYYTENNYISSQEDAKSFLQDKVNSVKQAKKEVDRIVNMNKELNTQIRVIRGLQNNRKRLISTLDAISKVVPQSVFLDKIAITKPNKGNTEDTQIKIEGIAENEKSVSEFMTALKEIKGLSKEPNVERIESAKPSSSNRYVIPAGGEVKSFVVTTHYLDGGK